MKEKQLLKIAMISSIIGLILLFFFTTKIKEFTVSETKEVEEGRDVKIIGKIERINDIGKVMYISVGQEKIEKIDVVLFKEKDFFLYEGQTIEVIGTKSDESIIGHQVRII